MHRYIIRFSVASFAVYWMMLFLVTHWPRAGGVTLTHGDKIAHAVAYAILAWLAALVWRESVGDSKWGYAAVLLGCACYGALDEWTQGFVGRQTDLLDWLADVSGAAIGLFVFHWSYPRVKQLAKRWLAKRASCPPDA